MQHNRTIIYFAGFLFSVPIALTSYINSTFLENFASESYVGIIYVIASAITIIVLAETPKFLARFGNRRTTLYISLGILLSLVSLAFVHTSFLAIVAFVLYFITINLIIETFDIFMEDFSERGAIGGFRGFYMGVLSFGWVVALITSGFIIDKVSFRGIYLLSAFFMALVALIFTFTFHNFKDRQYKKVSVLAMLKTFIKNNNIKEIYFINLILKFFYAWMVIYTPIYLNQHIGLGWDEMGIIFAIMIIPFVILDFPLGRLSDKIGEKEMLIAGFLIISIFTLLIPFIQSQTWWIWALVLFMTRVGAAAIDTMSESYFFKNIQEENISLLSFFRNTNSLSYVIAPLVATLALVFIPSFKYLFVILSTVLLAGLLISLRLKDTN